MNNLLLLKDSLNMSSCQKFLEQLYEVPNKDRSFFDFYGYLDRTAGYLCKALSLGKEKSDVSLFMRPISWLFSLCSLCGIDVEEAFIARYPSICPYCLTSACQCYKTDKKPLSPMPAYKVNEEMEAKLQVVRSTYKVFTLDVAVKNVMNIFAANEIIWHYAGPWHHIAKIHEELAEVHEAYCGFVRRAKPLRAVEEEVADVLAWILGAWGITWPSKSLRDAFIDYYLRGCPVCQRTRCGCPQYSNRTAGLVDYKLLGEVLKNLKKLAQLLPEHYLQLNDLIRSCGAAVEMQNTPTAMLSISQTSEALHAIEPSIPTTSDIGNQQLLIIKDILHMLDKASDLA